MKLSVGFLEDVRVMTHTLVEHMGTVFPNPWDLEAVDGPQRVETASPDEVLELAEELEGLLTLSTKLTRQLVRAHKMLETGKSGESDHVPENYQFPNHNLELSHHGEIIKDVSKTDLNVKTLTMKAIGPAVGESREIY